MPDAIVHTVTRVVRRQTLDPAHTISADESKVLVTPEFDLAGGPWKLPPGPGPFANTDRLIPTAQEIDDADQLPLAPELQTIVDALLDAENAPTNQFRDKMLIVLQLFRARFGRRPRVGLT